MTPYCPLPAETRVLAENWPLKLGGEGPSAPGPDVCLTVCAGPDGQQGVGSGSSAQTQGFRPNGLLS